MDEGQPEGKSARFLRRGFPIRGKDKRSNGMLANRDSWRSGVSGSIGSHYYWHGIDEMWSHREATALKEGKRIKISEVAVLLSQRPKIKFTERNAIFICNDTKCTNTAILRKEFIISVPKHRESTSSGWAKSCHCR